MIFTQDSDFLIEGIEFIGIGDSIRDLELIAKLGKSEEFMSIIQYLTL